MEVRNCKQCGRLYNYVGGSSITYSVLCPDCIEHLEDKFQIVKYYIEEHKNASINEISQECEVSTKQIEQWIREDRLFFSENSNLGVPCEKCGRMIQSGKYCMECKNNLQSQLNSFYKSPEIVKKKMGTTARMRFLDN